MRKEKPETYASDLRFSDYSKTLRHHPYGGTVEDLVFDLGIILRRTYSFKVHASGYAEELTELGIVILPFVIYKTHIFQNKIQKQEPKAHRPRTPREMVQGIISDPCQAYSEYEGLR